MLNPGDSTLSLVLVLDTDGVWTCRMDGQILCEVSGSSLSVDDKHAIASSLAAEAPSYVRITIFTNYSGQGTVLSNVTVGDLAAAS